MGNVEGEIKQGVHTLGLTPCLHIVLGMHTRRWDVHTVLQFSHVSWGFAVCTMSKFTPKTFSET